MERRLPVRVIAGCLGMAAFAVAIVSGLSTGVAAGEVLARAIGSLFVCYIFGIAIAMAAEVAVRENLTSFENDVPMAGSSERGSARKTEKNPATSAKAGVA